MKKITAIIAILMIILLVDTPIYVSAALGEILNYRVTGKDNVENNVRKQDVLKIEANVIVEGDNQTTPDQVWLGSVISFDSCTKDVNGFLCKLSFPKNNQTRAFKQKETFTISLHSDGHTSPPDGSTLLDTKSGMVVIDSMPPKVELNRSSIWSGNMTFITVSAKDESYASGITESCSGIKTIEISAKNKSLDKILDYPKGQCSILETFNISTSALSDGPIILDISAVDYMNNSASFSDSVIIDRTPAMFFNPHVMNSATKNDIAFIGSQDIDGIITIDADKDIDMNTVKADLSGLNSAADNFNVPGICSNFGNLTTCQWNTKILPNQNLSNGKIIFKASDLAGNYKEQDIPIKINKDLDAPKLSALQTDFLKNGINYLKENNNTIYATISDPGVGLDAKDVLIDLSALGGPSGLKATSCESGKCIWKNVHLAAEDGNYTFGLNKNTQDLLGNKMNITDKKQLIYDKTPPQLKSIEAIPIGGPNAYDGFVTQGDSFEIRARFIEKGILEDAYADLSPIISGAKNVLADECKSLGNSEWECTWQTDPINVDGYISDQVKIYISDFLGNTKEYGYAVEVYSVDSGYNDYWQHTIDCSPSVLDREVMPLIDQRVFCHVNLIGSADIVSLKMGECVSEQPYLKGVELINNAPGSKDLYLKVNLASNQMNDARLSITCPLVIISRSGHALTSIPEVEEVHINIPYVNPPLGAYERNIQYKVDEAVDDATGTLWKIITGLNKVLFYAERVCSLILTINNVANLMNVVGTYKKISSYGTDPLTAPALWNMGASDQSIAAFVNNNLKQDFVGGKVGFLNKFCKFVSCRLFYDEIGWNAGGEWQRTVLKYANLVAIGGPLGEKMGLGGKGVNAYTWEGVDQKGGTSTNVFLTGGKLEPKDSIVLSFATLCIPGIVYHLDKYRQIKCMYADCLQTSVETGVPIAECEHLKEYETCKYIYGEVFQLLPFTGLFNYLVNLVKGVLYNPLGILDLVMGYVCTTQIMTPGQEGLAKLCLFKEVAGIVADVWADLSNFKDSWKIKTDYCSRLQEPKDNEDDKESDSKKGEFLGGLFS